MIKTLCTTLLFALLLGCAPKETADESTGSSYPYDLTVDVNHEQMLVSWKRNGNGIISGYNVYISSEPLGERFAGTMLDPSITPHNRDIYPGDTDSDDGIETYLANDLENGAPFYVTVRVVFADRTLSKPTKEIKVVCGGRGEIELAVRYKSDHDGFSFKENTYVRADASNNDVYFFSKGGLSYLASPTRLNGFLNDSRLVVLDRKGAYEEIAAYLRGKVLLVPAEDRVQILVGDWVQVKTFDDRYALLQVRSITGSGGEAVVKLSYAYSALFDEMFF